MRGEHNSEVSDSERSERSPDDGVSRRGVLGGVAAGLAGAVPAAASTSITGVASASSERPELIPDDEITHHAVRNGAWNDPATWADGAVPGDGAQVLVEDGATVTVTHQDQARLRAVRVDGTLRFDPSVDSGLNVDTLLTTAGSALRIGTAEEPVAPGVEARITFIDTGPIDEDEDPMRVGRGLVVRGDLTVHGAPTTAWTTLSAAPSAGDQELSLSETPTDWQAGDRVVVPGVVPNEDQDEVRQVASADGSTVRLDSPLEYDHSPPASDLDAYVLNLSRNVVFESENRSDVKRRGHIMVMSTATEVRYALFDGLGRTNKDQVITNPVRGEEYLEDGLDTNRSARYAFHYHKTGIEAEPHYAEGLVVDGSPGWGVVNHHAHAHVTDSVTYDVLGAGFVAEGGNERGSFGRNFALRSEGSGEGMDSRNFIPDDGQYSNLRPSQDPTNRVDDFGHAGHGFWLQSPLVETVDNVAAGHRHYAFVYWTRPLLDGQLAEATEPVADRVGTVPNLPLEYVVGQQPLKEAIESGRGPPGEYASMNPGKISSAFVRIRRFEGNEAFASAGGLDVSRNQFKWEHERFGEFSPIEDFTVHSVGPHIDEDGNVRGAVKRGVKKGGNQGIKLRYVSNVTVRNSRLLGRNGSGVGIAPHDYLWTAVVENSTIEGWHLGVGTGEHRLTWVRNNALDNEVDLDWVIGNTGPLVAEGNDLDTLRYALSLRDVKAGELFGSRATAGGVVNGRPAYFHEQRADYVPIESEEELVTATLGGGYGNMADVIGDDAENVIGLTNRELMEQYGVATGGALLPEDAVDESFVAGGELGPGSSSTTVWLDPTSGTVGDGFDVVYEPEASNDRCLRVNSGTAAPPEDPSNVAELSFDCAEGTYTVFGRIWTGAWNGDTVYYRIDGGEWLAAEKLKQPRGFKWFEAAPNGGSPYEVELSEGTHTLEIGCANDGVLIDKLLVADNPAVVGAYGGSPTGSDGSDNSVPTAAGDTLTVKRGGTGTVDVLANDSDSDGSLDPSSVTVTDTPSNGSTAVSDGLVEYAHDGSETTSDSFTYTVDDDDGATSDEATVSVTVEPEDGPTASDDSITIGQGESGTVDVLANDSGGDGTLAPSSVTLTGSPSSGTATVSGDGLVEYTHDGTETTADSFTYTVDDDEGTTSNEATVSVAVELDSGPTASDDTATVGQGKSVTVDVLANDSGGDGTLDASSVNVVDRPAHGVAMAGDGTVTYRHDGTETTADSFTYTVDSDDGTTSNAATVSITIDSNNDPSAADDDLTVERGGKATVDVLENDDDRDGSLDPSTVAVTSRPSYGSTWVFGDGTIEYSHDGSRREADSFDYTVDDDDGAASNEATVSVSVEPGDGGTDQPDDGTTRQSPYTDHDLARIQAEDFDTGGEGVAYHDTNRGNKTGVYRDTDVDLQETKDSSGAYNVAWIREGEWWEYTVDVPADGEYALTARVAGKNATSLDVAVDGSQVATVDVPDTGDWQDWTTVDAGTVDLPAGTHTVRATANGRDFNINWFGFERTETDSGDEEDTSGSPNDTQSPYTDHDLARIQAEDFDTGGEGVAYHDTSDGNKKGVYRDTDVDLQETKDSSGAYNVAWIREGEWWEYTVDVPADGEYTLRARLAGKNATSLDVAVDGSQVTTVDVPDTGDWQDWTTVDAGTVSLSAGTHTVRLTANGGEFNINWFGFE